MKKISKIIGILLLILIIVSVLMTRVVVTFDGTTVDMEDARSISFCINGMVCDLDHGDVIAHGKILESPTILTVDYVDGDMVHFTESGVEALKTNEVFKIVWSHHLN